jgi:hypothetical protein
MKIDKTKWHEFKFNEVFSFERGKRLTTENQIAGDIAYISSSKINNGIDNHITPPSYMRIYQNAITLNNSGSIGYCFYHIYKFVASDHCTILQLKDKKNYLDLALFLFLKPIIETMKSKYGFAREMSNDRLGREKVLLPAKKIKNNFIPDYEYIKKYIKIKSKNIIYNKPILKPKNILNIDSVKWQEFKIKDLFELKKGERLTEADRINGSIPLITASSYNNGITSFIDYDTYTNKKKLFKNKITVDMFGNIFYQMQDYFSDDNIHTLLLKNKYKQELNIYTQLFLITIIKKIAFKYGFGRQVRLHRLSKENIKLPVLQKDIPNWKFMEDYIKSLSYSINIR